MSSYKRANNIAEVWKDPKRKEKILNQQRDMGLRSNYPKKEDICIECKIGRRKQNRDVCSVCLDKKQRSISKNLLPEFI